MYNMKTYPSHMHSYGIICSKKEDCETDTGRMNVRGCLETVTGVRGSVAPGARESSGCSLVTKRKAVSRLRKS